MNKTTYSAFSKIAASSNDMKIKKNLY